MNFLKFLIILILSFSAYAGDEEIVKKSIIDKFTSGLSSAVENVLGGEGDTQVQITAGEDYKPEFSIVTVRPISHHPGVDSVFVQLQLNDTKIRGDNRLSINSGIGYRKLSDNKNTLTGANVFFDYDEEGNSINCGGSTDGSEDGFECILLFLNCCISLCFLP